MAVDLRCPNCEENLGKDTENPRYAYCGTCGECDIKNPRGYVEARHRDEYPKDMQEVGDELDLFDDDGNLKSFDQIMNEAWKDN